MFCKKGERGERKKIYREDIVHSVRPKDESGRVGVLFMRHAAIYFIHADEPYFVEWLKVLKESKEKKTKVRFAYDDIGQRLTSVEPIR